MESAEELAEKVYQELQQTDSNVAQHARSNAGRELDRLTKEHARKYGLTYSDAFTAVRATNAELTRTYSGHAGDPHTAGKPQQTAADALHEAALALQKADPALAYPQALEHARKADPRLAESYLRERMTVKANPSSD